MDKPKVFLVCTGVGHINRGYESFTLECFEHLRHSQQFELLLLKGGGKKEQAHLTIPCIQRNGSLAKLLHRITGREKYWLEQISFLFGMLPSLIRYKPSVIYYSDFVLGTFLWQLRRFFGFKYKLLFSNGAPNGPPFTRMDHIQQLLPMYVNEAIVAGTEPSKLTLLPYAITINKKVSTALIGNKQQLLEQLQLPKNKKIIISVGAVNSHHKRIDYLVREFAAMKNTDYFLVVLGQIDELSTPILEQAKQEIIHQNYLIKQVKGNEVPSFLAVADYFVLASLYEGLPRVLPEAMNAGLLPIVHDYQVTRETLENYGVFRNMNEVGVLQGAIDEVNHRNVSKGALIDFAYNHYSWDKLASSYESIISNNLT